MNPFQLLFGFSGRINRAKFWLAMLISVVFFFVYFGGTIAYSAPLNTMFDPFLVGYVPLIISAVAVGIKRLHDRNKSGWWLLLFYAGPLLLNAFGHYVLGGEEAGMAYQVLLYVSFAINIWALVELGCLRGTIGRNQYGSDPLAPQPAPPRALVR